MADSMRSINSFGVAGLLHQSADVFYTNDVRARNVGRVSDLISAKLRESDADELRIRALLLCGLFQAYAIRGLKHHHQEELPPVSVEIGIDPVHIVVAISFHWDAANIPRWKDLGERVDAGRGENPFEKILELIVRHSTQVIVRQEAKDRRIEIVSILNRFESVAHDPTMVVTVDSKTSPLLEVSSYTELGDLNFAKLLRNPVAEAETNVAGRTPQQTLEEVAVKGEAAEALESVRVKGGGGASAEVERRFGASTVGVDEKALAEIREEYESTVSELKNAVHELKERLEAAENAASERRFTSDSEVAEGETTLVKGTPDTVKEGKADDWGIHFLKQVWPFAAKKDEAAAKPDEGSESGVVSDGNAAEETVMPIAETSFPEGDDAVPTEPSEAERAAELALRQLQDLTKTKPSKKVEATLKEIEAEGEPHKAKRWVDSLSSELLQEKAKLSELQKTLAKQMRQRELEFKTAERSLKQELKRKEEMLYQRQAAIENKNDQIAQLNLAVERASSATSDKEAQLIKVKLDRAQKMAQMKEEESKALVTKVRDLENRLIIAQAKAQKGNELQSATKIQGLEKKVDEYKRINQRLMESLNSQKEKSNDKEVGDLRRKIDQLDRLNVESKRNLEKNAFKLRELQESERKLQADLARTIEENRNLRKSGGGGNRGSGESGGQAA